MSTTFLDSITYTLETHRLYQPPSKKADDSGNDSGSQTSIESQISHLVDNDNESISSATKSKEIQEIYPENPEQAEIAGAARSEPMEAGEIHEHDGAMDINENISASLTEPTENNNFNNEQEACMANDINEIKENEAVLETAGNEAIELASMGEIAEANAVEQLKQEVTNEELTEFENDNQEEGNEITPDENESELVEDKEESAAIEFEEAKNEAPAEHAFDAHITAPHVFEYHRHTLTKADYAVAAHIIEKVFNLRDKKANQITLHESKKREESEDEKDSSDGSHDEDGTEEILELVQ
jgi:hypothetical protein